MATGVISCHRSTVASEKSDATSDSMPPGKLTVSIHTLVVFLKLLGSITTKYKVLHIFA